jgi:hypothetical protein
MGELLLATVPKVAKRTAGDRQSAIAIRYQCVGAPEQLPLVGLLLFLEE